MTYSGTVYRVDQSKLKVKEINKRIRISLFISKITRRIHFFIILFFCSALCSTKGSICITLCLLSSLTRILYSAGYTFNKSMAMKTNGLFNIEFKYWNSCLGVCFWTHDFTIFISRFFAHSFRLPFEWPRTYLRPLHVHIIHNILAVKSVIYIGQGCDFYHFAHILEANNNNILLVLW